MLTKDEIREFTFSNYGKLIAYCKENKIRVKDKGISEEEIVNDVIVNLFDSDMMFVDEKSLLTTLTKSMKNVYFLELSQSEGTVSEKLEKYPWSDYFDWNMCAPIAYPSRDFCDVYYQFESLRFHDDKKCNWCGCSNIQVSKRNVERSEWVCRLCGKLTSITSGTYLHNTNFGYLKLYKTICLICKDSSISTRSLRSKVGGGINTFCKYKRIVSSAMYETNSQDPSVVLKRLLKVKKRDSQTLYIKEAQNNHSRKLTQEDVLSIRRLHKDGVYSARHLSEVYGYDLSNMYKLLNGKAYV